MDASARGSFVWHELMTHDPAKAAEFYSGISGWKAQKWQGGMDYTLLLSGKEPVAGIMALPSERDADSAVPAWLGYIGVSDVDAIATETQRLGGRVIRAPADIPNAGRFAVLADPQGIHFGIYGAADTSVSSSADKYFVWHELVTTDQNAALRFYQALFGWREIRRMNMGAMGDYVIFGWDDTERGGIMTKPAEVPTPYWVAYQNVPDARKTAERIKSRGGTVIMGPHQIPGGGWIVMAIDPTGAMFAVHSRAEAAQAEPKAASRPAAKKAAAKSPVKVKAKPKKKNKTQVRTKPKTSVKVKTGTKIKSKAKTKSRSVARKNKATTKKRPATRRKIARKTAKRPAKKK